jgi:hypothetical protein
VTRQRRNFTPEYDALLSRLWRQMPPLSVQQIAERMGCTERRVKARACILRKQGKDLAKRAQGVNPGFATPLMPEDWPTPQPVTIARRDGDRLIMRIFSSVGDWRARRFGRAETAALAAARPRHGGTFRGLTACGAASPWLSVVPSAADGARFDGRAIAPLAASAGSPAAMCVGEA